MFQFPARRQTKSVCTLITNWTKDTHTSAGHDTARNAPVRILRGQFVRGGDVEWNVHDLNCGQQQHILVFPLTLWTHIRWGDTAR